ncbi:MAG: protein phosphatase 2C domain-containing protein [Acidobacteriaceae bacterium]|nr:protein phosphatase 2C domain-containing protein [Acidobacteriaceae bacterium]
MKTAAAWRTACATDPGLQRTVNEDRVLADEAHGIFLVVDGLGGHAAGELAAETALKIIEQEMLALDGREDIEISIRRAITRANNYIVELAASNKEWQGMACVLTLAVAQEDRVTVGHVGDSRLYLTWNGNGALRKITSDHSPVGELEERGELSEVDAMRHPRRNEVFRDVGSHHREIDDPEFIEIKTFLFRPDAALLLCSDGLSDVLTSLQINSIVEQYNGDPQATVHQLVQAANAEGGQDNISVVFVAGPDFVGESAALIEARPRHAITRMKSEPERVKRALSGAALFLMGMALGILLWAVLERLIPRPAAAPVKEVHAHTPTHIAANAADPHSLLAAVASAQPDDTIDVPAGEYFGPLELKEHVNVIATTPHAAILRIDPAAGSEANAAVVARGLKDVRVEGLKIVADAAAHPLRVGVAVTDSSIALIDMDVSGATEAGVQFDGNSSGSLLASSLHANTGPGVIVGGQSTPRLVGNWIVENGRTPHSLRRGIEIQGEAHPVLENNVVERNGLKSKDALSK